MFPSEMYILTDYYMKVVFGKRLYTAVLVTPSFTKSKTTDSCLQFQYRLSDTKVVLRVQINDTKTTVPITLVTLSYQNQSNSSDWNTASAALDSQSGQLMFVAEKIGYTAEFSYAVVRGVAIYNTPCTKQGKINKNKLPF